MGGVWFAGRSGALVVLLVLGFSGFSGVSGQESAAIAPGALRGTDFVSGAAAVDLAGYVQEILGNGAGPSPRFFDLTSQWTQATFLVRDTDNRDLPLVGATAGGVVDGSLITYRLGVVTPAREGVPVAVRFFTAADFFVASHLSTFFDLITPNRVTPGGGLQDGIFDISGSLVANWIVPLGLINGGGRTGFATRAFQVLPGISLEVDRWAGAQVGIVFRYRDPINEDGRFISRFYESDIEGDYRDSSHIPDGVDREQRQELFFAAQVLGTQVDTLLDASRSGTPVYAAVARDISPLLPERWSITLLEPRLAWRDAEARPAGVDSPWNPALHVGIETRGPGGHRLHTGVRGSWYHEPAAFDHLALDMRWRFLQGGVSLREEPRLGLLPGWRAGVVWNFGDSDHGVYFDVSYNHIDGVLGALEVPQRVLFNLGVRL